PRSTQPTSSAASDVYKRQIKAQRLEYLVAAHLLREVQQHALKKTSSTQSVLNDDPLFNDFARQLRPIMPIYFRKQASLGNLFLHLLTREAVSYTHL
ncbi:hypothetical protein KQJ29_31605, partial [Enterococcus sp. S181_ASV_20]|nr:hypothetical protein [Enterococcus sp. S181_ASV_20]